jgi:glucokinase
MGARAGNAAARQALKPAAHALGTALAGAVALTGAELVVVSGGVSRALDVLAPPLLARLQAHLPPHLRGVVLRPGAFGPKASLIGAALAAARHPIWEPEP